ncbi:ArdC-like ssDNA-binding domain-containing protein [Aquibacillus sp. 3ASR75-11]|uniref:ArdC-like ssDNA-binding domain-containing protein n=1 Tax=Terrihalobacillus insolitus TaxID=2950438 RepID=A0A9X3WVV5_9BACI|nr:ArdC-like ssDNA-binding domain-containing protein [Terrihalobacillus insolitus]MDC3424379.1 ArdC-like ssDNA-binding domain-containing protein [Terrihalobacillus insolitus]
MSKKGWKNKGNRPTQKERVEELLETLEEGVLNFMRSPEQLKAILEMKALMPSYSFRNLIVAKAQLPHASFIASFKRWNELGRKVKKGQKALRIFAPRFVKAKDEEKSNGEDYKLIGFITVPVFDYTQTEGDPLPIDKVKIALEGDCPEAREIISLAEKVAEADNCPITYGDTGVANGFYSPMEHSITVSSELSINHRCKTLVHELVHSIVDRFNLKSSKKEQEVVAEGTAFVVCSYFGLDTSDYSFQYVKSWSKEDDEAVMKFGTKICDTAAKIIQQFEALKEEEQDEDLKTA